MDFEGLAPVFRRHGVRFAYLWGSRAGGRARADSDYDFAVSMKLGRRALAPFLDLCADLSRALDTDDVDVTLLEDANTLVRYEVQRTGVLIFERDREARIAFECRARKEGWDEAPHWAVFDRHMARRLREGTFGR